ncbi:MAG TPA: 3-phosphoshikimate 1-carboxyvinyltransferase [Terrisporobacter glycolicus]|uniref:3-phosphoshikimate 1-carboxyvinyltransferase n=1 Tax=Terrisporobacter TaxID=1505652 RepID=UPI000E849BDB|nr:MULTISPECIES: 3-phosphoshikimate 1-carboxyvinyltransferase [Terrisporobacter]MBN9647218.1 3-phosphoshikimate 1-carboxyvinyltransferase [Terrisporobacter glycolicus]HBI93576.1 3-phosphoshikimate 1-carboxyvinyltransferase [Terrisporobacter hibernicus]
MLKGSFELIGDKSISHRAIMLSSISKGKNKISNFLMGEDCLSTVNCFRKMGVDIEINNKEVYVSGKGLRGLKSLEDNLLLDVGNSGTTIRLIMGILAGQNFKSTIVGDESIGKRPMKRVTDPLREMGAIISGKDDANLTPITIEGGNLTNINYHMPVSSAQVKSSLILASLYGNNTSFIREKVRSRNHTEIMLKSFGADIEVNDLDIKVNPVDELFNKDIYVPGDISSAAFIMVGALISENSEVLIKNVGLNHTRVGIIEVIKKMNGNIEIIDEKEICGEKVGNILVKYSPNLIGTTIDKDLIPKLIDEIPIIALLATRAEGDTIIKDASELKVKESNRIKSVVNNLNLIGAKAIELEDGMIIKGKTPLHGGKIQTFNDHRIAMSFSIANLISNNEVILDSDKCIDISFPGYFNLLKKLSK